MKGHGGLFPKSRNPAGLVERYLSPIQKPRTGREGDLCSGVTLMSLAWAEFRGQTAVQSNAADFCGLLKETRMALQSDNDLFQESPAIPCRFFSNPIKKASNAGITNRVNIVETASPPRRTDPMPL